MVRSVRESVMGSVREEVMESTGGSTRESIRSINRVKESGREE